MNTGTKSQSLTLALLVYLSFGEVDAAGFHVWIDETGRKQVSTIPRDGFNHLGDIRRPYDPNSLTLQHHEMRRKLALQAAEIAQQQAEPERLGNAAQVGLPSESGRAPKEGIMGLRGLIQLERRGGRYSRR